MSEPIALHRPWTGTAVTLVRRLLRPQNCAEPQSPRIECASPTLVRVSGEASRVITVNATSFGSEARLWLTVIAAGSGAGTGV